MKSLRRISEQIKDSINQFMDAIDDNESLIKKTIDDMRIRINEAKEHVATAIGELNRLKYTYTEAVKTAQMWKNKVDSASQDQNPETENNAEKLQQHLQRVNELEQQIQNQETIVADLTSALKEFHQQFREASKRVETLSHQQKQAETREEFYKLLAEFDLPDENTAFQQAEQELKETEARAKMWEERNRTSPSQTEANEKKNKIDETLAALKSDILGSREND